MNRGLHGFPRIESCWHGLWGCLSHIRVLREIRGSLHFALLKSYRLPESPAAARAYYFSAHFRPCKRRPAAFPKLLYCKHLRRRNSFAQEFRACFCKQEKAGKSQPAKALAIFFIYIDLHVLTDDNSCDILAIRKKPRARNRQEFFRRRKRTHAKAPRRRVRKERRERQKDGGRKMLRSIKPCPHFSAVIFLSTSPSASRLRSRLSAFFRKTVSFRAKSCHTFGFPAEFAGAKKKLPSAKRRQTGDFQRQTSAKSASFGTEQGKKE